MHFALQLILKLSLEYIVTKNIATACLISQYYLTNDVTRKRLKASLIGDPHISARIFPEKKKKVKQYRNNAPLLPGYITMRSLCIIDVYTWLSKINIESVAIEAQQSASFLSQYTSLPTMRYTFRCSCKVPNNHVWSPSTQFPKIPDTTFVENPSCRSRTDTSGQTDRQTGEHT